MDILTLRSLAVHQPRRAVAYRTLIMRSETVSVECAECAWKWVVDNGIYLDGTLAPIGKNIIEKTNVATRDQVHSIVCSQCQQLMEFA